MDDIYTIFRRWYGFDSWFSTGAARKPEPRQASKHKANARQPKRDALKREKVRRNMAKASRKINRK